MIIKGSFPDSEAFVNMKIKMEENIASLTDQIQLLEAVHQMNEERLDYEIHVLRKHEEEIVLVKSEQKRKITNLQVSSKECMKFIIDKSWCNFHLGCYKQIEEEGKGHQ